MIKQPITKLNDILRLHSNQCIGAQVERLVIHLKVLVTKVMGDKLACLLMALGSRPPLVETP